MALTPAALAPTTGTSSILKRKPYPFLVMIMMSSRTTGATATIRSSWSFSLAYLVDLER